MGTLSSCLKKHKLGAHEAAILRGAADENIKDGDPAHVAAVRAVSDRLEELFQQRTKISEQVTQAGGKAPEAPFSMADVAEATEVLNSRKTAPVIEQTNSLSRDSSWVIRNKVTGEVVMETFDRAKVDALNTAKYEAVPIREYLASLNKKAPALDVGRKAVFMPSLDAVMIEGSQSEVPSGWSGVALDGENKAGGYVFVGQDGVVKPLQAHNFEAALEEAVQYGGAGQQDNFHPAAGQQATHVEGAQIETATPAVVAKSLQKSARNTAFNLKEAQHWLLKEIDAALMQAPTAKEKGVWDAVNSKVTLEKVENVTEDIGFKVFDVPGDGTFKVLNVKEKLLAFRKNVEKSPGFKNSTGRRPQNATPGATYATTIAEMLEDGELTAAFELIKTSETPYIFGAPNSGAAPVLYLSAKEESFDGIEFYVAKDPQTKSGSKPWRAIEKKTRQSMGDGATAAAVMADVQKRVGKDDVAERLKHKIEQSEAVDPEALERQWIEIAEAAEEGKDVTKAIHSATLSDLDGAVREDWRVKGLIDKNVEPRTILKAVSEWQAGDASLLDDLARIHEVAAPKAEDDAQAEAVPESVLEDMNLLKQVGDRWKYRSHIESPSWFTANTKEDAVERATATYHKAAPEQRLTKEQRFAQADADEHALMQRNYGHLSLEDLRKKYNEYGGDIASLQQSGARELDGNGGRRTSAAVSSQGARETADERMRLGRYIAAREKESTPEATALSGNRRDPTKVSMFAPYEADDIVSLGGKDWQVKSDVNGWYLTDTGNWRGTHPTIKNVKAMSDLIRAIEQASVTQQALKIGDAATVMGIDVILAKTRTDEDGVRYELFNAAKMSDTRGVLRVTDVDSGNVVSLQSFDDYAQAESKFDQVEPVNASTATAPVANTRNAFTVERLNRDTDQIEKHSFKRGQYVKAFLSKDRWIYGEIEGVSQAQRKANVGAVWHTFGSIYETEQPAPKAEPAGVPLSQVVDAVNAKHGAGLTEADRIMTLEQNDALRKRIIAGDPVTADDVRAAFERVVRDKSEIVAELSKFKKDDLEKIARPNWRGEKKDRLVAMAYDQLLTNYAFMTVKDGMLSYRGGDVSKIDQFRGMLAKMTDADVQEWGAGVRERTRQNLEQLNAAHAAIANPQTLADFKLKIDIKGAASLTPVERAKYEDLQAEATRAERAEQKAVVDVKAAEKTVTSDIIETKHTKTLQPLFVVQSGKRVERDVYNLWNATAKKLGGWYSSFRGNGAVPGFQFKTREGAEAFKQFLAGETGEVKEAIAERREARADEKDDNAVTRLRAMADTLENSADSSLNADRKTNTARRARMASGAESQARGDKQMAQTMRRIANAIESGEAVQLAQLRTKAQIAQLSRDVETAKGEELRQKYPSYGDQERHKGEPPTEETSYYAEFPQYIGYAGDLMAIAEKLASKPGAKLVAQRLQKVIEHVQEKEYQAAVKADPAKFSLLMNARTGLPATLGTVVEAGMQARKLGLADDAYSIVSLSRGKHMVIATRQHAINNKKFVPDSRAERLTIGTDLAETMIAKATENGINIGYWLPEVFDRRKRLAAMGITDSALYRAALREFIRYRADREEADKATQLERSLVGRKDIGIDFFPTPKAVAAQMVERAGIEPGMRVLEPSAGNGNIAESIRDAGAEPEVAEISSQLREVLEAKGFEVVGRDFMDMQPDGEGFDRIVMNPPFGKGADIDHVRHAYSLLKPGGRIVAIMGEGAFTRSDSKASGFQQWLEDIGGEAERLPPNTFQDAQLMNTTGANARLVTIEKPEGKSAPVSETLGSDTESVPAALSMAQSERDNFTPIELGEAAGVVAAIRPTAEKVWNTTIRLVPTFDALPSDVKEAVAKYGEDTRAKGVLYNGAVYVVADEHGAASDVEATILHEIKGHVGIRRLYGNEISQKLNALYVAIGGHGGLEKLAHARGFTKELQSYALSLAESDFSDAERTQIMVDELLAHIAEAPKFADKVKAIVGAIREWLRGHGFPFLSELGETDLLHILSRASDALQTVRDDSGPTALSMAAERPTTNSNGQPIYPTAEGVRNFWDWFGGSKVVDAEGRPLVVYHGTLRDIIDFKTGAELGAHFGTVAQASEFVSGQSGQLMPVLLSIKNPVRLFDAGSFYTADVVPQLIEQGILPSDFSYEPKGINFSANRESDAQQSLKAALATRGIDGIVYENTQEGTGGDAWIAFYPEQIKSAIGNNGDYAQTSADIRYSKDGVQTTAAHTVDSLHASLADALNSNRAGLGDALLASDRVRIITRDQIQANIQQASEDDTGNVRAFVTPDGTIYFVADQIGTNWSAAELLGLSKHEIAVHALQMGRGTADFQQMLEQLRQLRETDKRVQKAYDRVPKGTPAEQVDEEALAYLVQTNPTLSIVDRAISFLRKLVRDFGKSIASPALRAKYFTWADTLSASDMLADAHRTFMSADEALAGGFDTGAMIDNHFSDITAAMEAAGILKVEC